MLQRVSKILKLSWPIAVSFLSYHIMGIIDVFMIGKLGKDAVAAVGLGLTFFWFLVGPCEGFFENALILFSRSFGSSHTKELKNYLLYEILFCLAVSLVCMVLYFPVSWAMQFATNSLVVLEGARTYLLINLLAVAVYLISWIFGRFLVAIKKNQIMVLYSNLSVLLNIVLNYLLIYGKLGFPALGVAGAAMATVIARICFMILMMSYTYRAARRIFSPTDKIERSWSYAKKIIVLGFPMAQTSLIEISSWTIFVSWIGRLGTVALASHEIALKIKDFLVITGLSIGSAATSLIGENMGKRDQPEAKRIGYTAAATVFTLMAGYGTVLMLFPEFLVRLFIADAAVLKIGATLLRIMAVYQLIDAIFMVSRAALNGVEDVKFVRGMTLVGGWLVMLPTVYGFTRFLNWGVYGAWVGFTTYVGLCGMVFSYRFIKTDWLRK